MTLTRRALLRAASATAVSAGLGIVGCTAEVTPPERASKVYRLVFLFTRLTEAGPQGSIALFKKTMTDLGYVHRQGIEYDAYDAAGDTTRFPSLALQIVSLRPDLIVCQNPQAAEALMQATRTTPIVIVSTQSDVLEIGLVKDLAHPGGNLTGLTAGGAAVATKRLQLLKEIAPNVKRAVVLLDQGEPGRDLVEMQKAARGLGVEVIPINMRALGDLDAALSQAVDVRADALMMGATTGFLTGTTNGSERIAAFALERRWPTANANTTVGGLINYNRVFDEPFKRAAERYVDRIFKGAAPGDLPFEGPTRVNFVLNMCTATKLGLTVPQSVLVQVTQVLQCQ